jgi:hypothetical protein
MGQQPSIYKNNTPIKKIGHQPLLVVVKVRWNGAKETLLATEHFSETW